MSAAIGLRVDFGAAELRALAGRTKNASQARWLLALAAVYDGKPREAAARIGGMDRQTLRDWAHRFNQLGPDGLIDRKAPLLHLPPPAFAGTVFAAPLSVPSNTSSPSNREMLQAAARRLRPAPAIGGVAAVLHLPLSEPAVLSCLNCMPWRQSALLCGQLADK